MVMDIPINGIRFGKVTEAESTSLLVEAECEVPANGNVLRDQIISLPALRKAGEEPVRLNRYPEIAQRYSDVVTRTEQPPVA
jgi:hypothetical protein